MPLIPPNRYLEKTKEWLTEAVKHFSAVVLSLAGLQERSNLYTLPRPQWRARDIKTT